MITRGWNFSGELSEEQRNKLYNLVDSFKMWEGIGRLNTGAEMELPIKEEYKNKPSLSAPYPMSAHKRKLLDPILDQLKETGIIEDSVASDFSSPILLVVQKGKPRFVIDFRKINQRTPLDVYPLPRQDEIFTTLQGVMFISLFDIVKAFFQMPIKPEDRPKTTFITPHRGSYQLTLALMGYLNSPAFCQRTLDKLIEKYKWIFVMIYVDDIVVFSKSWKEHLSHIRWVLKTLMNAGITLDKKKAFLGFKSVALLGHTVNRFGLQTQKSKIAAMNEMKLPSSVQELESQLGFFGYYRLFVESYAQILHPLSNFLSLAKKEKKDKFELPEQCKNAIRDQGAQNKTF